MAKKTPNLKRLEFCHLLKHFCRPVLCVCVRFTTAPLTTITFSPESRKRASQHTEERVTEHDEARWKAKVHSQPKQGLD